MSALGDNVFTQSRLMRRKKGRGECPLKFFVDGALRCMHAYLHMASLQRALSSHTRTAPPVIVRLPPPPRLMPTLCLPPPPRLISRPVGRGNKVLLLHSYASFTHKQSIFSVPEVQRLSLIFAAALAGLSLSLSFSLSVSRLSSFSTYWWEAEADCVTEACRLMVREHWV